jgi:hypothetical protein
MCSLDGAIAQMAGWQRARMRRGLIAVIGAGGRHVGILAAVAA